MKDFVKKYGEDKEYLTKIARYYIDNDSSFTINEVADHFGISSGNVETAIRICIIRNYISYDDAIKVFVKASTNQLQHTARVTTKTKKYYTKLICKRYDWIKNHLTDESVKEVVEDYINDTHKRLGLSQRELNLYLKRGIVCGIATDEETCDIFRNCLKKIDCPLKEERVTHMLERLIQLRTRVQSIKEIICEVEFQIDTYDDVYGDSDDAPAKEQLEMKKDELEVSLQKILETV